LNSARAMVSVSVLDVGGCVVTGSTAMWGCVMTVGTWWDRAGWEIVWPYLVIFRSFLAVIMSWAEGRKGEAALLWAGAGFFLRAALVVGMASAGVLPTSVPGAPGGPVTGGRERGEAPLEARVAEGGGTSGAGVVALIGRVYV